MSKRTSDFCENEYQRIRRFAQSEAERGGDGVVCMKLMRLASELKEMVKPDELGA